MLTTGTCDIKFEMKSLVTPKQLSARTDEKKEQVRERRRVFTACIFEDFIALQRRLQGNAAFKLEIILFNL